MIYYLAPSVQRKIWGGSNLEILKNIPPNHLLEPVGETWEISIHPDGLSTHKGQNLVIDDKNEELPYLVKLIDTNQELSVQVHPHDEYARLHENSNGKSECWLILSAKENAIIYLGLKSGVTKESFMSALKNNERMDSYLNNYSVSAGDFFYVPAGTIHAIGAGITLAEVQQSSGITYRVWDWNRVDANGNPRQLHIDKSLDVINFDPSANVPAHFKMSKNLFAKEGLVELINHASFKCSLINLKKSQSFDLVLPNSKRLSSLLNLNGKITLNGSGLDSYSSVLFKNEKNVHISALEETSFLFIE